MRSLYTRLIVAFLIVSLLGIVLAGLYIWRVTTSEFGIFVVAQSRSTIATRLAETYVENGGWAGLTEQMVLGGPEVPPSGPSGPSGPREGLPFIPRDHLLVASVDRSIVMAGRGYRLGAKVSPQEYAQGTPVLVNGREVGRLLLGYEPSVMNRPFDRFMGRFYLALGLGGLGGTGIALLLGVLLARSMTSPLRELTRATQAMSRGDLAQRIEVRRDDELGTLARSFNQLSSDLVQAQAQRRQMTADISHELRTPLSLILGHAEALADGVLEPTQESLDIIYDEARRLTRLVDDLHTLSLSDAGELSLERRPTEPALLLQAAAAAHSADAEAQGLRLVLDVAPDLPMVDVDRDRIIQVLHNLLSNARRYTPDGGRIALSAHLADGAVQFRVQDSGPGIPVEQLNSVFDRFYRSDKARPRSGGGSGLGLAIARSIVERHGGRLWAESAPQQGATLIFELPAAGPAAS